MCYLLLKFELNTRRDDIASLFHIIIIDIDECLNNNGSCEDICINTEGSFYCQCSTGLALSADNRTCEGKNWQYNNT